MSIYKDHYNLEGFSGKRFWQWFDLMPKEVRNAINYEGVRSQRALWLWKKAVDLHGKEIQQKLDKLP